MKKSWFFEGISSRTSPQTVPVTRKYCVGHFLWKKIHQFSNSYFEPYFLLDFIKNPMIFIGFICTTMLYSHITIKFASKKHENFNEIEQKTWFKIRVGILMKIFSIRNVPNSIPWSLKVFPMTSVTVIPPKTMKISCFFKFVDNCRDCCSNSMHYSISSTETHFWRGRRAGSRRL